MFRNLIWLELEAIPASSNKIVPAVLANANHLLSLSIFQCESVGDELLKAIAQCKRLYEIVDLEEPGVSVAALVKYQEAKRLNWVKLIYKKTDHTTGTVYAIKSQSGEIVEYDQQVVI